MSDHSSPILGSIDPDHITSHECKIGQIATLFELIHTMLERFSWSLWGLREEFGSILTKDLPTRHLTEKIRATLREIQVDPKEGKQLKTLLSEVEAVSSKRNALMHSMWDFRTDPPTLLPRKQKSNAKASSLSLEAMSELIDRMEILSERIYQFTSENQLMGAIGIATKQKYRKSSGGE